MTLERRIRLRLVVTLAAFAVAPLTATAGPHGGGTGGHHAMHGGGAGRTFHGGGGRTWFHAPASRPMARDHRSIPAPSGHPTSGHGPSRPGGYHAYHGPAYGYGVWPYHGLYGYGSYGYGVGGYPWPGGAPGVTDAVTAPALEPRRRFALGAYLGQLRRDAAADAALAGISLRWRGPTLEAEVELGRRVDGDTRRTERSLAGTLYLNLGRTDTLHPYLLAGGGLLARDRMFGIAGAGLALPLTSRLTLAGDLRAESVRARHHHDDAGAADDLRARSVGGRLTALLDF